MERELAHQLATWILGGIGTLVIGGSGWLFNSTLGRFSKQDEKIECVRKDLDAHKLEVGKSYITREEQERTNDRIFEKLDKILDKIDTKQDKK